ncbi:MAG: hypothetical protein ACI9QL_001594 [Candidatus Omnitrophota bacterium]|jgi:hypothetical protein
MNIKMKNIGLFITFMGLASQILMAAPTVSVVGSELSSMGNGGGWGSTTNTGHKGDFRSIDSEPKAWILPGHPNAYGTDGYVFFATTSKIQESGGTYAGTLYTGSRSGQTFSNVTHYVREVKIIGAPGNGPGNWSLGMSGGDQIDDPSVGIGSGISDIDSGYLGRRFSDSGVQEVTNVLQFTFGDNVTNITRVRIGFMTDRGDNQKPTSMILGGVTVPMTGANAYVRPDWYFFDVTNAVPGDVLTLEIEERGLSQFQIINGLVFDSLTVPNQLPVITRVDALPNPASYTAVGAATSTVSVVASDADNDSLSYAWSKLSGPGEVIFSASTTATSTVSFAAVGDYMLQARVSDGIAATVTSNLAINVLASTGVTYVQFAGAEVSSTGSGGWDSDPALGYKKDFRSTDSDSKAYVLKNHPNAYGEDGYIFWTTNNNAFAELHTGTRAAAIYSNTTDYIASVEVLGTQGNAPGNYSLSGSTLALDDPTVGIGPSVPDIGIGQMWSRNDGVSFLTPRVRITLGSTAGEKRIIRIGLRTDRGDGQKPDIIALGGVQALNVGQRNYTRPDWYFFDVLHPVAGAELVLAFREGSGAAGEQCNFQGLVFDSVGASGEAAEGDVGRLIRLGNGDYRVAFTGTAGTTYEIQWTRNVLSEPVDWQILAVVIAEPDGTITIDHENPQDATLYYRALLR